MTDLKQNELYKLVKQTADFGVANLGGRQILTDGGYKISM